jgi:two-component system, OmpR family, sensor histidine kinase VicK
MEVFYGTDKVISEELLFFSKTRQHIDTCMDSTRPSLAIGIESIKSSFVDAKNRGVKLRYLTEITDANISYCKELMAIVDEVRHLDGIKGNFMPCCTINYVLCDTHLTTRHLACY